MHSFMLNFKVGFVRHCSCFVCGTNTMSGVVAFVIASRPTMLGHKLTLLLWDKKSFVKASKRFKHGTTFPSRHFNPGCPQHFPTPCSLPFVGLGSAGHHHWTRNREKASNLLENLLKGKYMEVTGNSQPHHVGGVSHNVFKDPGLSPPAPWGSRTSPK